jgi:hypothetical protein
MSNPSRDGRAPSLLRKIVGLYIKETIIASFTTIYMQLNRILEYTLGLKTLFRHIWRKSLGLKR